MSFFCRRTHYTFCIISPSYWDQSKTDGWYFLTPHIGILLRQADGRSTFHFTHAENQVRQTDRQLTFHFTHNIGFQARQTDKLNDIPSLIMESKQDRGTKLRSTYFVSFHPTLFDQIKTDGQTNVSFHPSYWNRNEIDGQTTVYFTSYLNLHNTNRRTNYVSFHPS